jgi:hypothetical protein
VKRRLVTCLLPLAGLAAGGSGCGDESAHDNFPILVQRAGGAFVADFEVGDGTPRKGVIDVMAPLTVLDQDPARAPSRSGAILDLIAPRSLTDPTPIVRSRWDANVVHLHPCDPAGPCTVGAPGSPLTIGAIIGADVLRGNAISFEPVTDRMLVLPDIAGDEEARGRACDVVVPAPFYGGGTVRIGDTEVGFAGLRIALGVCLSPDPAATDATKRGVDAALVMSTGIGISILSESRYVAWAQATGAPELATLPPSTALLPSGPIEGKLGRIDRLAIVGTSTAPRGACREVFSHHLMAARACVTGDGEDCPCDLSDDKTECPVAAIAELTPPAPIEVVVVNDRHPLLQALRDELRPEQPEIDGILGVDALGTTAFDVDYPDNRLLFRCVAAGCVARPKFIDAQSRAVIAGCVAGAPVP